MSAVIPDAYKDLIEGPVVVVLTTVMPDGQPQSTPVWCNSDGTHILVNSARGRQKDKNIRHDARVTILAIDPNNASRWIEVRGTVEDITETGAVDHRNALAKLYLGIENYYTSMPERHPTEIRVIYRIKPKHVNAHG
ncbi:MAG: PPOX class F420-dependent oxidoreductase [Anaerolineae bacterium]|nr:PPOX class F420-dependent oxidoreductase [Anaerolineae bacterium]